MIKYYCLTSPKSERLRATQLSEVDWEVTLCADADFTRRDFHQWDGQRWLTEVEVKVDHSKRDELLIWPWLGNCLVHGELIAEFSALGLTGCQFKPSSVRFRDGRLSREYRELVVVGWAGIAAPESGIHVVKSCPKCLHKEYDGLVNAEKLIDWSQWSGDDFFMVWPLSNHILITERVADLLQARHVKSYSLEKPDNEWGRYGFHGGRLSSFMPDDVAMKYGLPLGLESESPSWVKLSKVGVKRPKE
jgi:hypothetical protein